MLTRGSAVRKHLMTNQKKNVCKTFSPKSCQVKYNEKKSRSLQTITEAIVCVWCNLRFVDHFQSISSIAFYSTRFFGITFKVSQERFIIAITQKHKPHQIWIKRKHHNNNLSELAESFTAKLWVKSHSLSLHVPLQ